MSAPLTFWFDVVCPYAWLASREVEAAAARHGTRVLWAPILLGGLYRSLGTPDQPATGWSAAKRVQDGRDLRRRAELAGVSLRFHPQHPRRSVEAMRLLTAAAPADRPALAHDLFEAYWVHGQDIADREVLARVAAAHDQDLAAIDLQPIKDRLRAATEEALDAGVFGVPTYGHGGRTWWGGDRLHLVEAALGGPDRAPVLSPRTPQTPRPRLRFFHDFASPFSYLAWGPVQELARAHGVTLTPVPILLGGLFRDIGTPDVPMFTFSDARQAWTRQDLRAWAGWWGAPFRFPQTFPLRTVGALRTALVAPGLTGPLYRAAWADNRDIGRPEVLAEIVAEAGLDPVAVAAACQEPALKQRLRDNTAAAGVDGVCGVPTFHVSAGDAGCWFWGQDRLDQVDRALAGWRPADETPTGATG